MIEFYDINNLKIIYRYILPNYNINEFQEKYRAFKQEDYTYCRGQEEFDVGYKASLTKFQLICHVPEM